MRRRATLKLVPWMLFAGWPTLLAPAEVRPLLDRLRGGGHVLLLRHAQTVPGAGDPPGFRLEDCSTQRNLSRAGRAQARALGDLLREAQVPIGTIRSSAWCRCRETAELLRLGAVEHLPPLNSFFGEPAQEASSRAGILAFVASWRGPGNALLVTHQVNVTAVTSVYPRPCEAVVLTGGAMPKVVGRVPPA